MVPRCSPGDLRHRTCVARIRRTKPPQSPEQAPSPEAMILDDYHARRRSCRRSQREDRVPGLQRRSPRHRGDPRAGALGDAETELRAEPAGPEFPRWRGRRGRPGRSRPRRPVLRHDDEQHRTRPGEPGHGGRGDQPSPRRRPRAHRAGGAAAAPDQRPDRGERERGPVLPGPLAGADADGVRRPGPARALRRLRDRGRPGRRPRGGHAPRPPRAPERCLLRCLDPGDDHPPQAQGLPLRGGGERARRPSRPRSACPSSRPRSPPRNWSSG